MWRRKPQEIPCPGDNGLVRSTESHWGSRTASPLPDWKPQPTHAYSPDGWTPLHLNFGNVEIARLLIDSGADINSVSKNKFTATPLQGSVVNKSIEVGRLLLARGANVNPRNDDGGNPLHEAAGDGQIEFAKLLLDHGANINAKDDKGNTPLAIALEYKQTEMAKLLRDKGAVQ